MQSKAFSFSFKYSLISLGSVASYIVFIVSLLLSFLLSFRQYRVVEASCYTRCDHSS